MAKKSKSARGRAKTIQGFEDSDEETRAAQKKIVKRERRLQRKVKEYGLEKAFASLT